MQEGLRKIIIILLIICTIVWSQGIRIDGNNFNGVNVHKLEDQVLQLSRAYNKMSSEVSNVLKHNAEVLSKKDTANMKFQEEVLKRLATMEEEIKLLKTSLPVREAQ
jgi:hypothetical protein